jgi:hypothetical protein
MFRSLAIHIAVAGIVGLPELTFSEPPAADCNGNGVDDALDLQAGRLSFEHVPKYDLGSGYGYHVTADLNGDGDLDVATLNWDHTGDLSKSELVVLLANGDGTLSPPAYWSVPGENGYIGAAADFDDDVDLELAVSSWLVEESRGVVTVFLNSGDGSFPETATTAIDGFIHHAAPLDADGLMDLLLGEEVYDTLQGTYYNVLSSYLGNGDGTFRAGARQFAPARSAPVVADLDRDGTSDLMIYRQVPQPGFLRGEVSLLRNKGDGTFLEAALPYDKERFDMRESAWGSDLNGDGALDLAVWAGDNSSGGILAFLNDAQGGFKDPSWQPWPAYGDFLISDLDRDGALDLAGSASDGIAVLWGRGDGTFEGSDLFPVARSPGWFQSADMNGDGLLDLACRAAGGIALLFNRGERYFEAGPYYAVDGIVLFARDLDHDEDTDLVLLSHRGGGAARLHLLLNQGQGDFAAPQNHPVEGNPLDVVAADFDGDDLTDLGAVASVGVASIIRNQGRRVLDPAIAVARRDWLASLAAADLDRDGDLDLAALGGDQGDQITILFNDGNASFPRQAGFEATVWPSLLAVTDFDGDGAPDFVTAHHESDGAAQKGVVSVAVNGGAGTFGTLEPAFEGPPIRLLAFGDLDRDGATDIAAAGESSYWLLFSTAAGQVDLPAPLEPLLSLTAADLDGDGSADLAGSSAERIDVLLNRGGGAFEAVTSDAPSPMEHLTAADLDGDACLDLTGVRVDLSVRNGTVPGATNVLVNRKNGAFGTGLELSPGGFSLGAADLDGDARTDLAIANGIQSSGDLRLESAQRGIVILWNSSSPFSRDDNENQVPDECEARFHRGDPNGSGTMDISDGIVIFGYLFLGDAPPSCLESADSNNSGLIDISDGITVLQHLFRGGPPPAAPGPPGEPCGPDVDPPGSAKDLGCRSYDCL